MSISVSQETITPVIAQQILLRNSKNRKIRLGAVKKYAADMSAGRWKLTHQGIAFDKDGNLLDGQHRLKAVVVSDATVEMMVYRGLDPADHVAVDDHAKRSVYDTLIISNSENGFQRRHATLALSCYRYPYSDTASATPKQEIIRFLEQHFQAIDFVISCVNARTQRAITQAAVLTPVIRAWYHYDDKDRLRHFLEVLLSGVPNRDEDLAAITLRNWLLSRGNFRHSDPRNVAYLKTERALQAFMDREIITRLFAARQELFPFPEDPSYPKEKQTFLFG